MEVIKYAGDNPFPRFGHTLSQLSKNKVLLFGGATGNTGKYSINSDVFIYDLGFKKWRKIEPSGSAPSQRAAHASVFVDPGQVYIYGGATGGGGLSSDDLILLDFRAGEERTFWQTMPVMGVTPGRRYGHSLVFYKPFLLIFGGNTGNEPVNDVWSLNLEKSPLVWSRIETKNESPPPRVYHSASVCTVGSAAGMMVVFGGRTTDGSALADTWGFRRHRDGRWDWVKAPYKSVGVKPIGRYQHSTLFLNSLFLVVGGRTNNTNDSIPLDVYDTQTSDWYRFGNFPRFRHASWITDQWLFLFGGFDQKNPNIPTDELIRLNMVKIFQQIPAVMKAANIVEVPDTVLSGSQEQELLKPIMMNSSALMKRSSAGSNPQNNTTFIKTSTQKHSVTPVKNVRLASQAIIATSYGPDEDGNRLIRRLSIDKLQEESKKLGLGFKDQSVTPIPANIERLYSSLISQLLIPKEFTYEMKFNLRKDQVIKLCDEVEKILIAEPVLIHLKPPLKIYGNINGQFGDLMKLFAHFGVPCDGNNFQGDIDGFTYLFLGDYVDLGKYSVEVIVLLLALKIKYPDGIYLLRGHHEDRAINRIFGLGEDCARKFNEDIDEKDSVFFRLNRIFDLLPLAALIEDRILCVHGGIGTSMKFVTDIEALEKPIIITPNVSNNPRDQLALDLLYSDPVETESEASNKPNPDRNFLYSNIKKFGVERLRGFIQDNGLSFVIRSHECCRDGFERFANDSLITVFSAMDYCGKGGNAAAVLIVKKNFEVIPKVVYPSEGNLSVGSSRWDIMGENINDETCIFPVKLNKEEMTMKKKKSVTPLRF